MKLTFGKVAPGIFTATDQRGRQWYVGGTRGNWAYGSWGGPGRPLVMQGTNTTKTRAMADVAALAQE